MTVPAGETSFCELRCSHCANITTLAPQHSVICHRLRLTLDNSGITPNLHLSLAAV
ncbi:hypothetical protein [Nostoc sp. FACHB-280]|uniref:hypothetical protein n=1 Tax=Nostoc sp. FACHB-280 TaxID=2692839 RepID=UPI00168B3E4B|nr:hypothetical protein [Nostoc sp. FACHB-280]MBD2494780.1 hypothetical protein [Nostoc sp. FACHB-280]